MLKIAMLSKWHVHADGYAKNIQASDKAEISCIWDEDATRGSEWAKSLGVSFESDLDKLLARPDVDAVLVDAPTTMHLEVMVKAAKAGKHIFTEKALAPTVAECETIAEAVKKAGITFVISMPQRTTPIIQFAKKMIDNGEFGVISLARIRNGHNGVSGKWLPEYWFDLTKAAGGALMDLGCHPMYTACYLFGKPKKVTSILSAPFGKNCDMDESATATIEFEGGEVVTGETSFISIASPSIVEIYGTEATLIACDDDVKFKSAATSKYTKDFISPTLPKALEMPINQFINACVNGTGSPEGFTVDDGIDLTRILENCYVSSKENRTVIL